MMKRQHRMPFGAEVTHDGVSFSLYAPDVSHVDLIIEGKDSIRLDDEDGWKRAHVSNARAGDLYRYRLPNGVLIPDPAARFMPQGLRGAAEVIDPSAYCWRNADWRGRPWHEAVIYEVHIGAATTEGDYKAFAERLDQLVELGITAIELMPISQWPGQRNWGYDGVLPFAPAHAYGRPEELKTLVDRAHDLGMMVFLDVVYNHFGPSGNYLPTYAQNFFTDRHNTPWGAAINFDGQDAEVVRSFFINNAVFWIREYHLDGLRLDAVHAIHDDASPHILADIATAVREADPGRQIHLVLENDDNGARWLERADDGLTPLHYTAQWNDDAHHCWHALLSGERDGYYIDFCDDAASLISRTLAEGFLYQGDPSGFRGGERRGQKSSHLHPVSFVDFLQNHDQIGNRAFGERIDVIGQQKHVAIARSALLLSPHIPLLFMNEEWGADTPFFYFVDFESEPDLADAVREGRRREFAGFREFGDDITTIPDPNELETLVRSRLRQDNLSPSNAEIRESIRRLLNLRKQVVNPLIATRFIASENKSSRQGLIDVAWTFEAGKLRLTLNIGDSNMLIDPGECTLFYKSEGVTQERGQIGLLPWSIAVGRA